MSIILRNYHSRSSVGREDAATELWQKWDKNKQSCTDIAGIRTQSFHCSPSRCRRRPLLKLPNNKAATGRQQGNYNSLADFTQEKTILWNCLERPADKIVTFQFWLFARRHFNVPIKLFLYLGAGWWGWSAPCAHRWLVCCGRLHHKRKSVLRFPRPRPHPPWQRPLGTGTGLHLPGRDLSSGLDLQRQPTHFTINHKWQRWSRTLWLFKLGLLSMLIRRWQLVRGNYHNDKAKPKH